MTYPPDGLGCRGSPTLGDDNVRLRELSAVHTQLQSIESDGVSSMKADGLNTEIKKMADFVRAEVSEDNEQRKTMEHSPYDPNLVCPMCKKRHRVGEIQKYRKHVDTCDGGIDADEHMYR